MDMSGTRSVGQMQFMNINPAAVNIPANLPQRFGNSGRNNIRGPGFLNLEAGLSRDFKIKERLTLQFRAEGLDVLNHANFANPASDISTHPTASAT